MAVKGGFDKNFCYLIWCEDTMEGAIVDPSTEPLEIFEFMIGNLDFSLLMAEPGSRCCHNARLIRHPREPSSASDWPPTSKLPSSSGVYTHIANENGVSVSNGRPGNSAHDSSPNVRAS